MRIQFLTNTGIPPFIVFRWLILKVCGNLHYQMMFNIFFYQLSVFKLWYVHCFFTHNVIAYIVDYSINIAFITSWQIEGENVEVVADHGI